MALQVPVHFCFLRLPLNAPVKWQRVFLAVFVVGCELLIAFNAENRKYDLSWCSVSSSASSASVSVVTMCPAVVNLMSCWSPSMSACDVFMVVVVGGWVSWLG